MATQAARIRGNRTDWSILLILGALLLVGVIMIYSASYRFSIEAELGKQSPGHFAIEQATNIGWGLLALLAGWAIPYRLYRKFSHIILIGTMLLLLAMAVITYLFAEEDEGRWVFGTSVQPFEVAKIGAMVYIAVWLEAIGEDIRDITSGLIPFGAILGIFMALVILQKDYSSAALLATTAVAMLFFAGANMRQIILLLIIGAAALVAATYLFKYNNERLTTFLDGPFAHAHGEGYQQVQAQIAIHNGGLLGRGLGKGTQKFKLPLPHSDDIFAVIAEELGFIGALFILGLYGLLAWRGLRVAYHAADGFGSLLAGGIVSWIVLQALLNIAVSTSLLPETGTVLPFISHGGSSLFSGMAMVGILMNISRSSGLKPEDGEG